MKDILARAAQIKLLIFDVDGVLTDGRLIFGDDGQEYKAFHSRDGHGMKMLQNSGVAVGIITGRTSKVVEHRMANLGIKHVYQGKLEKLPAFEELIAKLGLDAEQVAYMGDDVVDLPIMLRVGLAVATNDAHALVSKHAHWQAPHNGGQGAARDLCELIMEAQGTLDAAMQHYLQ
ncbi:MAG: 3-deoxy-manno-octulosonate-8-phosphatase KdsC [Gammaproteobacteria bacterium]|nr:3-deoxy-manno-octulosonate-8-phosphatase KdsC [Gammaproteobacteria bacterium]MCF6259777.1 3-deoxy-manno-octulosonate-8-phosphatase KdsC [Gammaproteobacteria bacterium]